MNTTLRLLASLAIYVIATGTAIATDLYPWRNHAAPFGFLFGNEIDTHQQTRLTRDRKLFGFFYVHFTGVVTKDRYGVATHVDCNTVPDCTVGWTLNGQQVNATFFYHAMPDHPVYLVARPDIPQPGAHAHFHWLGSAPSLGQVVSGYLLQLTAVDRFCFIHHGAESASPDKTCRDNGGVNVDLGLDIATHVNIVTSRPPGL
jgi:hypothetical protein